MKDSVKRLSAWSAALGALVWLLALSACGSVPEIRYYLLQPETAAAETKNVGSQGLWLGVEELVADAPYDQDRLVYRHESRPAEVGFYQFTRWAGPLGRLFQQGLVDTLTDQGGWRLVEPALPKRSYDFRLRGRIVQAEEVDGVDGSVTARCRLALQLVDDAGALRWHGEVTGTARGAAADGDAVMVLMRQAASQALQQAGQELGRQLPE